MAKDLFSVYEELRRKVYGETEADKLQQQKLTLEKEIDQSKLSEEEKLKAKMALNQQYLEDLTEIQDEQRADQLMKFSEGLNTLGTLFKAYTQFQLSEIQHIFALDQKKCFL